jgi:hypothetical protein
MNRATGGGTAETGLLYLDSSNKNAFKNLIIYGVEH